MKTLQEYITEKILIHKNSKIQYGYHPKTKDKLKAIINKRIKSEGNECNLNDIDTSKITDMTSLFLNTDFNGDISRWDVSNVKTMSGMFAGSKFNQDISNWNVSNVKTMTFMFDDSCFNQDISNWDVSNVTDMSFIFRNSEFNQDISNWTIHNDAFTSHMFDGCPIDEKYKPNGLK